MNKKFLAKLLIFCMIFTMIPMTAFGANSENSANNTDPYYVAIDTEATVVAGKTVTLTAIVKSIDAAYAVTGDTTLTWATSDDAVATVANGVVTGVAAGTATITATNAAHNATGTCTVTVTAADVPAVEVDGDTITATLPSTIDKEALGEDEPAGAGVYKVDNDTVVIKLAAAGDAAATALKVDITNTDITNLKNLGATIVLKNAIADVTLDSAVLNYLATKVTASAPLSLEITNVTDDTTVDTVVSAYTVEFKVGNSNVLSSEVLGNTVVEVKLTVASPYAAEQETAYAYYLNDDNSFGDKLTASFIDNNTKVVVVAEHFSTIVLTDTAVDNGGSGSIGGGGSSSNVSIATKVTGGKVTVSPTRPTRGQTVTITVTPADGYKLDSLTVTDLKGNTIELTKVSDTKYTFVMPAGKVKVTPVFVKTDGSDKKDDTNVNKRFSDVAADAWYAEYINYVAENGLMNGYEDGRFGPNDKTTRAQIVTVLYRMEGEPAVSSSANFKDVSAGGQYYSAAVAWASRNSIVNGYEDGRFGPNDNVTREQIATILYRYATYKEYDTTLTGDIAGFSDAAKVSSWANSAIAWAVGEGLMNGDNGALRPQGNATRAEIAALLMRFAENIAK